MRILVSNDDGIHAVGIKHLTKALKEYHDVITIAPDRERSSCGHALTLGEPVRIHDQADNEFACTGFPADCILIGLGHVLKDNPPEVVISGINHGANLGQDRYYSGTIAAAREAAFRNIPSIAVSLVTQIGDEKEHFASAAYFVNKLLEYGVHDFIHPFSLLNINVPNLPWDKIKGVKLTELGLQKYTYDVVAREDTRGRNYFWLGGNYQGWEDIADTDCTCVEEGKISLTFQTFEVWNVMTQEQKSAAKKQIADKLELMNNEIF